jgi:hypothetical protein
MNRRLVGFGLFLVLWVSPRDASAAVQTDLAADANPASLSLDPTSTCAG